MRRTVVTGPSDGSPPARSFAPPHESHSRGPTMSLQRTLFASLVTAAVGAAGLVFAVPAAAAPAAAAVVVAPATDPHDGPVDLQGGKTTLELDAGTAGVLADNGVAVSPTGDARAKGARISFP